MGRKATRAISVLRNCVRFALRRLPRGWRGPSPSARGRRQRCPSRRHSRSSRSACCHGSTSCSTEGNGGSRGSRSGRCPAVMTVTIAGRRPPTPLAAVSHKMPEPDGRAPDEDVALDDPLAQGSAAVAGDLVGRRAGRHGGIRPRGRASSEVRPSSIRRGRLAWRPRSRATATRNVRRHSSMRSFTGALPRLPDGGPSLDLRQREAAWVRLLLLHKNDLGCGVARPVQAGLSRG